MNMDTKSRGNNREKEELEIFKIVGIQIHVLPKIKTKNGISLKKWANPK